MADARPNDHRDPAALSRDLACPSCGHIPMHADKCRASLGVRRTVYAIRTRAGRVITDPEWESPADVMRATHGFGATEVTGDLFTYEVDVDCPCRCPLPGAPI